MSFSSTPLGQGRRLDHNTFLNKPSSNSSTHPRSTNSPPRIDRIPTSYAYGAPTLGTRSPPKSSSRDTRQENAEDGQDDPALVRFARLKQREQALKGSDIGPRTITSPPNPTRCYHIFTRHEPKQFLGFGLTLRHTPSAQYLHRIRKGQPEHPSPQVGPPPPNRTAPAARSAGAARRGLDRTQSVRYVPDSEEERVEQNNGNDTRGKSPFDSVVDLAKRTAFYLRQRSQEPEGSEQTLINGHTNGNGAVVDPSYDYSAEEREYQALQNQNQNQNPSSRRANAIHKRNRMSTDNKAYRPPPSDLEESDEYVSEDGRKGRRKRPKKIVGGQLTLPVAQYDKRRKRKKGGKVDGATGEEEDEEESGTEGQAQSLQRASVPRASLPPPSRASLPRGSIPPEPSTQYDAQINDSSLESAEQGLESIQEEDSDQYPQNLTDYEPVPSRAAMSIGGALGRLVNLASRLIFSVITLFFRSLALIMGLIGRILGMTFDVLFNQPARWLSRVNTGPWLRYIVAALVVYAAWASLRNSGLSDYIPSLPSRSASQPYEAPAAPPVDISDLTRRLMDLERQLHDVSKSAAQSQDVTSEVHSEISGRLRKFESDFRAHSRAADAEMMHRQSVSRGVEAVQAEIQELGNLVKSSRESQTGMAAQDEEARAKLLALEERVGSVEGGVKEALELGKTSAKVAGVAAGTGAAWWNKLSNAVTIKSSDGQNVTALISQLVDSALSRRERDTLAKPDFALNSGGAGLIPSLTSPTLEIRPGGLMNNIIGFVTGNGFGIGRPPITALHHEIRNGHCWPFLGSQGQLGVSLARPVRIEEVTIDHVAKEIAWDMRSAPRDMELWGLVEGKDNVAKVKEWREEKRRKRDEARREAEEKGFVVEEEPEEEYPKTLPRNVQYVKVANFTYDIQADDNIQTFPVLDEIKELGVDFGIVVLMVKSNWGREFTCLYRLRVHGQMVGGLPLPYSEANALPSE